MRDLVQVFTAYGEQYVQYFIIDQRQLHSFMGINRPDFFAWLQRATRPPFDPVHDLREGYDDERFYRYAREAAWEKLLVALYQPGAFYDDDLEEEEEEDWEVVDWLDVEDWYRY